MASAQHLPREILLLIFSHCSTLTRIRARSVCKTWHAAVSDPYLWKTVAVADMLIPFPAVDHAWLSTFAEAPYLSAVTTVDFSFCVAFDGHMLAKLASLMPRTTSLVLEGCTALGPSSLALLAPPSSHFPSLTSLNISSISKLNMGNETLSLLRSLPTSLTALDLSRTSLLFGYLPLAHLTNLSSLIMRACTSTGLSWHAALPDFSPDQMLSPSLTELCLDESRGFNSRRITQALTHVTALKTLSVRRCSSFSGTAIADVLAQNPNINKLVADNLSVGDQFAQHLAATCSSLTSLALSFTSVTDVGFTHIADANPKLRLLNVQFCSLNPALFSSLVVRLPALTSITLSRCHVPTDGIFAIADSCHLLQHIDLDPAFVEAHAIYYLVEQARDLVRINGTPIDDRDAWSIITGDTPITPNSIHAVRLKDGVIGVELGLRFPDLDLDPAKLFGLAPLPSLRSSSTSGAALPTSARAADRGVQNFPFRPTRVKDSSRDTSVVIHCIVAQEPYRDRAVSLEELRAHYYACYANAACRPIAWTTVAAALDDKPALPS
ncbi:uncharacterized protein AMSG_11290 [Thecamonas trahens ATCC 50062]|uniref:F-box domain-containing protein n=1 Tax=Thecamonas trahens ATCC 50062 TaxID=461836 RepID=A0A0L0DUH4_THETB|nr:hypothetical protein AMSG_11290 [Thecamonas trahens ATCC 50062]KNC55847.1 hypothetical protein AMSG_11290 [Thecamonas trahens ATCC 50062]|eukprot:XP_013752773.1 hypothetical protein AMSG_11290 [Thecamonas trahens ATCC 50062]